MDRGRRRRGDRALANLCVVDSSVVIGLVEVDALSLGAGMFDEVLMPLRVSDELGARQSTPEAAAIQTLTNVRLLPDVDEPPVVMHLDAGERQVISVAMRYPGAVVLLDDRAARLVAKNAGLRVHGTLGILLEATRRGLIPSLAPLCERLVKRGFHLSPELIAQVLKAAGET